MFTGIVTEIGRLRSAERRPDGMTRFTVESAFDPSGIAIGASICHSGCCLTVTDRGPGWFTVEVSGETLACTTLGDWRAGARVNLERALKAGDELGGHLVSGHVDGTGVVSGIRDDSGSVRLSFDVDRNLGRFIAPKGSVAVDGVSLTVNEVEDIAGATRFGVNVIPHTQAVTTLGDLAQGRRVNVEVDMMARYVARLTDSRT